MTSSELFRGLQYRTQVYPLQVMTTWAIPTDEVREVCHATEHTFSLPYSCVRILGRRCVLQLPEASVRGLGAGPLRDWLEETESFGQVLTQGILIVSYGLVEPGFKKCTPVPGGATLVLRGDASGALFELTPAYLLQDGEQPRLTVRHATYPELNFQLQTRAEHLSPSVRDTLMSSHTNPHREARGKPHPHLPAPGFARFEPEMVFTLSFYPD